MIPSCFDTMRVVMVNDELCQMAIVQFFLIKGYVLIPELAR